MAKKKGAKANGEGNIVKRKDGRWMGQVMLGYRPDGTRDRRTVYGKTRQEVANKLAELKVKAARGELPAPSKDTLGAYLREWLEAHRRFGGSGGQGLRLNTYRAYESTIRLHIAPMLGDRPLQKVTATDLERLYQAMLDKGLGMRMAEMAHNILHLAFTAAVKKGLLARNPCDQVPSPPRTRYRAEDRPRLAWEDVPRVLEEARKTRYYLPILVAMGTGLRRGEVLGLTWRRIDFEAGVIQVREQLQYDADNKLRLVPLKTRSSVRDVPMPADVAAALRRHRAAQKVVNLEGFVFTNRNGGPIRPKDLDYAWIHIRRSLGLDERLHLHDLRGSYTTWLAERGVNPKAAAKILGHSDLKTTLALYQSVTKGMMEEAARALDGFARTAEEK
ncbi:tyrosine-type recombinase/integrase [Caldinitratiruptor microaerophilus]|nr:site-specific integrase [Caldinitratiruptor microaerophilus]